MSNRHTFSHLFEPISIGSMTIKNRIVMAAMGTGFATADGLITRQGKAYYEARAKGGAGLVIVENVAVDFYRGAHASNRPAIDSDFALPGLAELARAMKRHGAKAAIQLNHGGRQTQSKTSGFQPVAPSPVAVPGGTSRAPGETPRELTIDEIHEITSLFVQAAVRARRAGFDGIELHAAHGYLLAQFLSPYSNRRQDQYGGSLEKRCRLLIEILRAIRESVGRDYPVWCRVTGREYGVEGGLTLDDARAIAGMVNDLVDAIHVSTFGYGDMTLVTFPDIPGQLLPLAAAIKKVVTVPVIAVGRLTPEVGEAAIKDGKADMIAIGRGFLCDPDIPRKLSAGKPEDIRPCIACFHCQDMVAGKGIVACAVNGMVGKESEYVIKPAKEGRKIAVIGGGTAGMETARVLSLRGHEVVLFEKGDRLGGQLNLAILPPHKKERIEPLIAYLVTQLNKVNVEVRLNVEANIEVIAKLQPAFVVLAAGAIPLIPQLPGIESDNVVTYADVLTGKVEAGHKVVIIGGGSIGCEIAEFLFERGKEVTVVEMLSQLAVDMGSRDRSRLLHRVTALPVNFITNARCIGVQKTGVITTCDNSEQAIPADTVVLAVGTRPNNGLYPLLKARGIETHLAGDCWHAGRIAGAIADGLRLGCAL